MEKCISQINEIVFPQTDKKLRSERCVPLARIRYDANVQMQYQSQRSLVVIHESAFVKATLAKTENWRRGKIVALLTYCEAETGNKILLRSWRRSNIDITERIGKDRRDYIRDDRRNEVPFIRLYPRSGTSLSNESRVGKTSFTWQSHGSAKLQVSSQWEMCQVEVG